MAEIILLPSLALTASLTGRPMISGVHGTD